jgi:hypothetical protein
MPIPIPTGAADSILKSLLAPWLKRRELKEELEQLKRELRHAGDVRSLSQGLVEIRKMLIADSKALDRKANREFFDKWCQHSFVKLGWLPGSEFWNRQNIEEFLADLESVKL